jgi:hypothetical protein
MSFIFHSTHPIKSINEKFKPVLFGIDANVIFISSNFEVFKNDTNIELEFLNKCFKANRLSMNFHKIHCLQFTPNNNPEIYLDIRYVNKLISHEYDTEFLGIYVYNTLL